MWRQENFDPSYVWNYWQYVDFCLKNALTLWLELNGGDTRLAVGGCLVSLGDKRPGVDRNFYKMQNLSIINVGQKMHVAYLLLNVKSMKPR